MGRFLTYFLIAITFIACSPKMTKTTTNEIFPNDWFGKWKGTLIIYNNKGKVQEVPMQMHIHATDSSNRFVKALIYGEGEKQDTRPYELMVVNAAEGHYRTDEKNTIFLDEYYMGGVLYSRFEVMGSLLLTRTEKRGEKLYFEVISGSLTPVATTGGDTKNEIPLVNSYKINVSQRAELTRF
jgi:hypothetical protein